MPFAWAGGPSPAIDARIPSGLRRSGVGAVMLITHDGQARTTDSRDEKTLSAALQESWDGVQDLLVVAEDTSAALLLTVDGYWLAAGDNQFLRAFAPEGADQARASFMRAANRLASHPELHTVAASYPPRLMSAASSAELSPNSHTAEQVRLMRALTAEEIDVSRFFTSWLTARREALQSGERTRGPLAEALDQVFYVLEDYPLDPADREEGDATAEDVITTVRAALGNVGGTTE